MIHTTSIIHIYLAQASLRSAYVEDGRIYISVIRRNDSQRSIDGIYYLSAAYHLFMMHVEPKSFFLQLNLHWKR